MKGSNKIFLSLFFLLLSTVFLDLSSGCLAESSLKISDVQYGGGAGKPDEDFIKIANISTEKINLKGYRLVKRTKTGTTDTTIKSWASDAFILPGGFYLWANSENGFAESIKADAATTQTISEGNGIALRLGKENEGTIIDSVDWKEAESPPPPEEEKTYDSKIIITEVLPHPSTGQEEYIELYNPEKTDVSLENYILRDGSKTGKYVFPKETEIKSLRYLVVYKKYFEFALNDSGEESVFVYDPNEKIVDQMSYATSKENYSWNFDGSKWRLSHFLTPGQENIFEKILVGKVEMDDEIYAGMYANFRAKSDSDAQKFTWDFGDGHKSYLQKTQHKYEKPGKYDASLKITGNGEDNLYNFTVNVEEYSAPKVKITSLVPNPKGKDTSEYIIIQNKSNKKINLLNWSVAAGWKNLYNHPIRKDFVLKKGQSKKLTKKFCAFTLNNSKTKIELRDPTGEIVQKLKYDRMKNKITDDETYELAGKNWSWNAPENNIAQGNLKAEPPIGGSASEEIPEENNIPTGEVLIAPASEIQANIGKFTPDISWNNKKTSRIQLISYGTVINTPTNLLEPQGRVAGASIEKYTPPEKHWATVLFDNSVRKINFSLNLILNKIL